MTATSIVDPSKLSPLVQKVIGWVEELSKYGETSAERNIRKDWKDYLKLLVNHATGDEMHGTEGLAFKLNAACVHLYFGDAESAKESLNYLRLLDKFHLPPANLRIIETFNASLNYSANLLLGLAESIPANLCGTALTSGKIAEATLYMMKSFVGLVMGVPDTLTLKFQEKATKIDQQCNVWQHHAYRTMRRIRKKHFGKRFTPSKDEQRLAKTAYGLCPVDATAVTDYAIMLKERVWGQNERVWKGLTDSCVKCANLFLKAISIAEKEENVNVACKAKLHLAEFITFGKCERLNSKAGQKMLERLIEEYPSNTMVLHKVGKMYHYKSAEEGGDLTRAKKCYKLALNSCSVNYPCLMNYLRLLREMKEYEQMINEIDEAFRHFRHDSQIAKLKNIKAFIVWMHNPCKLPNPKRAAIELWLEIVTELPVKFMEEICAGNDFLVFSSHSRMLQIRREVREYFASCSEELLGRYGESETLPKVTRFLTELRNSGKQNGNSQLKDASGHADQLALNLPGRSIVSPSDNFSRSSGRSIGAEEIGNPEQLSLGSPNERSEAAEGRCDSLAVETPEEWNQPQRVNLVEPFGGRRQNEYFSLADLDDNWRR